MTGFVRDTGRFVVAFRPDTGGAQMQAKAVKLKKKNLTKLRRQTFDERPDAKDEWWDAHATERAVQIGLKVRQAQLMATATAGAGARAPNRQICWRCFFKCSALKALYNVTGAGPKPFLQLL